MKILIVSATDFEIKPLLDFYRISTLNSNEIYKDNISKNLKIDFLFTCICNGNSSKKFKK